jgi:hypothetical protein
MRRSTERSIRERALGRALAVGHLVQLALGVAHGEHRAHDHGGERLAVRDRALDLLHRHRLARARARVTRAPVRVAEQAVAEHALRLGEADRRRRELLAEARRRHVDVGEVRRVAALVEERSIAR